MRNAITPVLLTVTEVGMLLYWLFASAVATGLLEVSPEAMYPDYLNPTVVIWNWSFLPLDVLFAVTGLASRYGNLEPARAQVLAVFSLSLMFCAGLMALSFWVIQGYFDITWWGMNLWLLLLAAAALFQHYGRAPAQG